MKDIYILFGTQTGLSEDLALDLQESLEEVGIKAECENIFDVKIDLLKEMKKVFVVVSTWGEGEPPDDVEDFYADMLALPDGAWKGLEFGVCALGDSGYEDFCECGIQFDRHLERLGGVRLVNRVDCDIDYEEPFEKWKNEVVSLMNVPVAL